MEKTKTTPVMKMHMHWGYDPVQNKLVETGFSNGGDIFRGTSSGQEGDKIVWTEDGTMMGQPAKMRTTVTRKGPNEILVIGEMENAGKWAPMGEDHCKKK